MIQQPLVSVIIATYNREKYIKRAIESVLNQTYKNIEVIVVDDSVTNAISKIVNEIQKNDSRIIYIKNKNRIGFVKSLNRGIAITKGKYIARLDDDDFWCNSRKLEKQVQFLEKNQDYVLIGGGIIEIDEEEKEIYKCFLPETDEEIRKVMLFDPPFLHSAVVFRKNTFKLVGGYNEQVRFGEDWDLWLRLGRKGKLYNFQDYFTYYLVTNKKRNFLRREKFKCIGLRRKYRNDYPGYSKAILLGWLYYFYSFVPDSIKRLLSPIISRLRKIMFGPPGYKYKTSFFKK